MNRVSFSLVLISVILILLFMLILPFIKSDHLIENYYEGPDALTWLQNNKNPYAFASNHFGPTTAAIDFIEKLYAHGARAVYISSVCIYDSPERIEIEGGPYADGLVVKLSTDETKRDPVIRLCESELGPEMKGRLKNTIKNDMVFLWWN